MKLSDITIHFGGLTAVDSVSFELEKGTIFGLIGPNGAGKTTLFNIISGVYKPSRGDIFFKEQKISGLPPFKINKLGIARTYQNIQLFNNMTVLENVMVGFHSRTTSGVVSSIFSFPSQKREEKNIRENSRDIINLMGLDDKQEDLAHSLSYGDQRLLEICRAIASGPEIILLDEPAAGMNSKEKDDLMRIIKKVQDLGIAILIVEHDMKVIMGITDEVFVLNYGKQIAHGRPDEIQKNQAVIEAYLGGVESE